MCSGSSPFYLPTFPTFCQGSLSRPPAACPSRWRPSAGRGALTGPARLPWGAKGGGSTCGETKKIRNPQMVKCLDLNMIRNVQKKMSQIHRRLFKCLVDVKPILFLNSLRNHGVPVGQNGNFLAPWPSQIRQPRCRRGCGWRHLLDHPEPS